MPTFVECCSDPDVKRTMQYKEKHRFEGKQTVSVGSCATSWTIRHFERGDDMKQQLIRYAVVSAISLLLLGCGDMIRVKPVSLGNVQELAGAESSQTARVMTEDANGGLKPYTFKSQGLVSASDSGMVLDLEADATLRRAIRVAEIQAGARPGSRIEIVMLRSRPLMAYTPKRWVNMLKALIPFYAGRNYIVETSFGIQLYQGDTLVRKTEAQRQKEVVVYAGNRYAQSAEATRALVLATFNEELRKVLADAPNTALNYPAILAGRQEQLFIEPPSDVATTAAAKVMPVTTAVAPVKPTPVYSAGAIVQPRAGAPLRGNPTLTGVLVVPELASGTQLLLSSRMQNAAGTWWMVKADGKQGWILESDIAAGL